MLDMVIRGGTVVDGTNRAPFPADVGIRDGVIVTIGTIAERGREEIDAGGAIVTPGFIDIHTHYDGQYLWDDQLEPSFSNGVTTAIAGNCGVGFAPAREKDRRALIEIMEGVEDIPGIVLDEGLDWSWTTFPEYMDKLAGRAFSMDVATHIPHAPIRVYVMGDRAIRDEPATTDDIIAMQRLVREGLEAGAFGFSAARIIEHRNSKGGVIPGTFAKDDELLALAQVLGEEEQGVFQLVPLGAAGNVAGTASPTEERLDEHDRIVRIARAAKRPVTYILHAHDHAPGEWRMLMERTHQAQAEGLDIRAQVPPRGLGMIMTLAGYHPFRLRPSYVEVAGLPLAERAAALRDPARRAAILSEEDVVAAAGDERMARFIANLGRSLDIYYELREPLDYEPDESRQIGRIAEATGRAAVDLVYDILARDDGGSMLVTYSLNFIDGNLDAAGELLADPYTVSGLGDGGAHLPLICDAAGTTFHLSFWARDRQRGERLPLEMMVWKLTGNLAQLYGLDDRGTIAVGKRADLNVIDFERVGNDMPRMIFDLPKGGPRLLQVGRGYRATIVNGVVTRRDDEDTGARPGRLLRAGRQGAAPTKPAAEAVAYSA